MYVSNFRVMVHKLKTNQGGKVGTRETSTRGNTTSRMADVSIGDTTRQSLRVVPPREEVMRRIEALASAFVESLSNGTMLDLETLRRTTDAMEYDEVNERLVHNQETRLVKFNRAGARKYTAVWLILQSVHELLTEKKTVTQRELYYLHPFFKNQSEADEAIIDVGCILRVPRSCLNIFGATKGCFSGRIRFKRDGEWKQFECEEEYPITQQLLQIDPADLASDAECILVVEKDGIFNRLREDEFTKRIPSILVTGRGFPDLATRMFVSMLSLQLKIPVYGLSDCNPFGLSIMLTYKIGSARMPLDTQPYTIDMRWIGLRPSSIEDLALPPTAFKPLSSKDVSTAHSLLKSSFVQTQPAYREELEHWVNKKLPFKIELEALHLLGFGFLSIFVEASIKQRRYI